MLAWLYVLNFYEGGLPSARSIGILADSAEQAGAPADYVAALRALPCAKMGDSNAGVDGHEGSRPGPRPDRSQQAPSHRPAAALPAPSPAA